MKFGTAPAGFEQRLFVIPSALASQADSHIWSRYAKDFADPKQGGGSDGPARFNLLPVSVGLADEELQE